MNLKLPHAIQPKGNHGSCDSSLITFIQNYLHIETIIISYYLNTSCKSYLLKEKFSILGMTKLEKEKWD